MSATTCYATLVALVFALTLYVGTQKAAWAARGIRPTVGWFAQSQLQAVAAGVAAAYVQPAWGSGAALGAGMFAWLTVLAVSTDLATRKVPWDIFHPVAAVGLVAFLFNYTTEGALALGAALIGVVGVPHLLRALTRKGLGMSDVRYLWAASATTSWWVGQNWLLYAVIAAALLQLVVRVMAPLGGWGTRVPVPARRNHPDPAPATTTLTVADNTVTLPHDDGDHPTVATRLELPFAPALALGLWAAIGAATYYEYGACQMWNPFGTC